MPRMTDKLFPQGLVYNVTYALTGIRRGDHSIRLSLIEGGELFYYMFSMKIIAYCMWHTKDVSWTFHLSTRLLLDFLTFLAKRYG